MFLQQASRSQLPVRALGGRCWAAAPLGTAHVPIREGERWPVRWMRE